MGMRKKYLSSKQQIACSIIRMKKLHITEKYTGSGSVLHLAEIMRNEGARKVMIVTDETVADHGHTINFEEKLKSNRRQDIYQKISNTGPHRDDFSFYVISGVDDPIDVRRFGSQGQQRTCALSLKLSEIETVRALTGEDPVLMLDDVLSELDRNRQKYLLDAIGSLQTIITCTGLDDFVGSRLKKDRIYRVEKGVVKENG